MPVSILVALGKVGQLTAYTRFVKARKLNVAPFPEGFEEIIEI